MMDENTDNGFIPNDDVATETSTTPNFQCEKCERVFTSAPALRMHHIRKHTKGWNTGDNFKKQGSKWSLARRRKFNKAKLMKESEPKVARPVTSPGVLFCPRCGCNIKNVAAAIAFGDRQ